MRVGSVRVNGCHANCYGTLTGTSESPMAARWSPPHRAKRIGYLSQPPSSKRRRSVSLSPRTPPVTPAGAPPPPSERRRRRGLELTSLEGGCSPPGYRLSEKSVHQRGRICVCPVRLYGRSVSMFQLSCFDETSHPAIYPWTTHRCWAVQTTRHPSCVLLVATTWMRRQGQEDARAG